MFARDKRAGGEPKGRLGFFTIARSVRDPTRRGTGHVGAIIDGAAATASKLIYPTISRALKK